MVSCFGSSTKVLNLNRQINSALSAVTLTGTYRRPCCRLIRRVRKENCVASNA